MPDTLQTVPAAEGIGVRSGTCYIRHAESGLQVLWCMRQCVLQGEAAMVPEDVGRKAAHILLEEIARGGVTDGTHQVGCLSVLSQRQHVNDILHRIALQNS